MCIRSMASINIANCLYGAIWEKCCIRLLITTIDTVRITRILNFFIHIRKLPLSQQRQKKGFHMQLYAWGKLNETSGGN